MKKIFPLSLPGNQNQRVLEGIKNDVRKYVKRERRKRLPEGIDFWDFNCQVGPDQATAQPKHPEEVIDAIDAVAAAANPQVYVEILSKPGHRTKKPVVPPSGTAPVDPSPPEDAADAKTPAERARE
jgi:hypothetical protein